MDARSWVLRNCKFAAGEQLTLFDRPSKRFSCQILRGDGYVFEEGVQLAGNRGQAESGFMWKRVKEHVRKWMTEQKGASVDEQAVEDAIPLTIWIWKERKGRRCVCEEQRPASSQGPASGNAEASSLSVIPPRAHPLGEVAGH